jgi:hypothetical protein
MSEVYVKQYLRCISLGDIIAERRIAEHKQTRHQSAGNSNTPTHTHTHTGRMRVSGRIPLKDALLWLCPLLFCILTSCSEIQLHRPDPKKSVLITGGAGFFGRHIANQFCIKGYTVTIVDNLSHENALSPQHWPEHLQCPVGSVRFIQEDCRDFFRTSDRKRSYWTAFLHLISPRVRVSLSDTNSDTGDDDLTRAVNAAGNLLL